MLRDSRLASVMISAAMVTRSSWLKTRPARTTNVALKRSSTMSLRQVEQRIRDNSRIVGQFEEGLLSDLFHEYSMAWQGIIDGNIAKILSATEECVSFVVDETTTSELVRQRIKDTITHPALKIIGETFRSSVNGFMSDHSHQKHIYSN
jgi:hypothetical protein